MTYKIKANEKLFNEWMRVVASLHAKIGLYGADVVRNDMELSAEQLNEWYAYAGELIEETEKHFAEVVEELYKLRRQTVEYIRKLNE